ncbi:rRNA adenine dimethylase [Candidatus Fermentibacteria bacterium]|nr:rRNA adenine dimethylase [Candidatus Fermentibacteria bacterium]
MKDLLRKYACKLGAAGMADPSLVVMAGLDDEIAWNRPDPSAEVLEEVLSGLDVNSILFARPAEPYWTMISLLAEEAGDAIAPTDCETRTFLHDIPVSPDFEARSIVERLKRRKSVVIPGRGVAAWGTVSPEQAFIFFSSVCFSCFVKFCTDYLDGARRGTLNSRWREAMRLAAGLLDPLPAAAPPLTSGPLSTEAGVRAAMAEAGLATVRLRLVDSFFGNISFKLGGTLFISQTTSSMDELAGAIDACPLDGSACTSITASSEYTAHVETLAATGADGILHGHPKFSVIMSMDCLEPDCPDRGACHVRCGRPRTAGGVPVVPGEVGTGPTGLCNTLPSAFGGGRGAIVFGHGLFTLARGDFNGALQDMLDIETRCRQEFLEAVDCAGGSTTDEGV